jgi:predicted nucleotidyltransferase
VENGRPVTKPSEALTARRDELRQLIGRYSVAYPRVYGSVLTGEDDDESDLDLLVEATERTTLFTLVGLEHEAQRLFGVQVLVLTPKDLPMQVRNEVLQMAQPL